MPANPLNFYFDGDVMVPVVKAACERAYQRGHTYRLAEYDERTMRSHRHYFACIRTAWQNLPEAVAARYPTSEHLRKHALIVAGYADERTIVAADGPNAQVIVSLVEAFNEYSVCRIQGNVVRVWTPQSQSMRSMGKKVFEQSKQAVLGRLATLIGVSLKSLCDQASMDIEDAKETAPAP